jgi:hypothetical protein
LEHCTIFQVHISPPPSLLSWWVNLNTCTVQYSTTEVNEEKKFIWYPSNRQKKKRNPFLSSILCTVPPCIYSRQQERACRYVKNNNKLSLAHLTSSYMQKKANKTKTTTTTQKTTKTTTTSYGRGTYTYVIEKVCFLTLVTTKSHSHPRGSKVATSTYAYFASSPTVYPPHHRPPKAAPHKPAQARWASRR